jgi:hypothetical protein
MNTIEKLKEAYTFAFGELGDFATYSNTKFVVFMLFTFMIPLTMMNLLIAIMSDSYARVTENAVAADSRSLADMILETEQLVFYYKKYFNPDSVKSEFYFLFYTMAIDKQEEEESDSDDGAQNIEDIKSQLVAISEKLVKIENTQIKSIQ